MTHNLGIGLFVRPSLDWNGLDWIRVDWLTQSELGRIEVNESDWKDVITYPGVLGELKESIEVDWHRSERIKVGWRDLSE